MKTNSTDTSYGAAYDELDSSDTETSIDSEREETLSGNYRDLCRRLRRLKNCFNGEKFSKIIDLEKDDETGMKPKVNKRLKIILSFNYYIIKRLYN